MKKLLEKKNWSTILIALAVLVVLGLITALSLNKDKVSGSDIKPGKTISLSEATLKAERFVNDYLMPVGETAKIREVVSEYGLYKLSIDITTDVVESYLTKDGRLFFPQALDINEITSEYSDLETGDNSQPVAMVSTKTEKPTVELFVMSHCPFGTQIEKGILPVVELLGDSIDFDLKFTSYAMHGEIELTEQINQHCIKTEQADKLYDYLACFLEDGDTEYCLAETNINKTSLNTCFAKTDKEYSIMDDFRNQVNYQGNFPSFYIYAKDNASYNVAGSPTLVINGEVISSGRDSNSLLNTICSGFIEMPAECGSTLSNATPSAGFGYGISSSSVDASCL